MVEPTPTEKNENIDQEVIYPGVNLEKLKFEVGQEMGIKPKQKN